MAYVYTCNNCGASVTVDGWPSNSGCAAKPGLLGGHDWTRVGSLGVNTETYQSDGDELSLKQVAIVIVLTIVIADVLAGWIGDIRPFSMIFGGIFNVIKLIFEGLTS
jgi:hypothetical protein